MIRIEITGTSSAGKTLLAKALAKWLAEFDATGVECINRVRGGIEADVIYVEDLGDTVKRALVAGI